MIKLRSLFRLSGIGMLAFLTATGCSTGESYSIEGDLKTWHTLTFSFEGPRVNELDFPNPFLKYRLMVEFKGGNSTYRVPGYFAADGNAAESGSTEGNIWQVRFKPDHPGAWSFRVSFREGEGLAVSDDPEAGDPVAFDGLTGSFTVQASDSQLPDFRARGRLEYVGERYLRFAETGAYFLKGGADSPENFLAYHEFDGTYYGGNNVSRMGEDSPNPDLHTYETHVKDWNQGDPVWHGDKGKGIIGALNYLSSTGMNSVYFLTMNVLGDGDDVWPWIDRNERYRFDVSRLEQWEIVFSHMEHLGIMMHIVLQETENECLLDVGRLDVQRKLYLREMIARFSHHLAVTWNIGEENGPTHWSPVGQSVRDRKDMMTYIHRTNPYNSFVVSHTHSTDPDHSALIEPFLGFKHMQGPSLQLSPPALVHDKTKSWIDRSRENGSQWVVCSDELGQHWKGVMPDSDDPDHDTIRKEALWGNLMAGGGGVEWYFGYNYAHGDLNCEDWRSRENMWHQTRIALEFFQNYLPFQEMESHDELVDRGYCFANPGKIYAVYLPDGGSTTLDLSDHPGRYTQSWFDPRNGGEILQGEKNQVMGGATISSGTAPEHPGKDWVFLVRKSD